MALDEGKRVALLVREDLDRLHRHVAQLVDVVGGSIGSAVSTRVEGPLDAVRSHLTPLLDLLAGIEAEIAHAVKRGPRKDATASAATPKRRRRRGGRGRKANITPEILEAALREANGVKTKAAEILKVSQPTLYKYLAAFGSAAKPKRTPKRRSRPRRARKT